MENYTDRMDEDIETSLYEYRIIRNPKNDKCVICINAHEMDDTLSKPNVIVEYISIDDVEEELKEANDGYFKFIDSKREIELAELDNNYLTHHIFSLWQWNGAFQLDGRY
jgi:hypothetical protein